MDIKKISTFIRENCNEDTELLSDLQLLEEQNTSYDTNYAVYRDGVDRLTKQLDTSRSENIRLLALVKAENINNDSTLKKESYEHSVEIFKK